jgi:hypothetical protein
MKQGQLVHPALTRSRRDRFCSFRSNEFLPSAKHFQFPSGVRQEFSVSAEVHNIRNPIYVDFAEVWFGSPLPSGSRPVHENIDLRCDTLINQKHQ